MDYFIVFSPKPLDPPKKVSPRGVASRYARLDVAARVYLAAQVGRPPGGASVVLPVRGKGIAYIEWGPECRGMGERLLVLEAVRALLGKGGCAKARPLESWGEALNWARGRLMLLMEGAPRLEAPPREPATWVMGGHLDPPREAVEEALRRGAEPVSVGPESYLSSHVAAYIRFIREVHRL